MSYKANYEDCTLCGRLCHVDRTEGLLGRCAESDTLRIASAGLHRGEEPPLCIALGSGTVFLSSCGLGCSFCQNRQISCGSMGRTVTDDEFVDLCLSLQESGAANINLVTGTHFAPSLRRCIAAAKAKGLTLPVVWNSSGYDTRETVSLIGEVVDIFLPDCKTLDVDIARQYLSAPNYPDVVRSAIDAMVRCSPLEMEGEQLRKGTIIRHLVLPSHIDSSRVVLEWFSRLYRDSALLSVMVQYDRPHHEGNFPEGTVDEHEYDQIVAMLDEFDIDEGFMQDLETETDWIPDFSTRDPFPPGFYTPVWHWAD